LARLRRANRKKKKTDGWMFTPDRSLGGFVRGYNYAALSGAPERRTKRLSRRAAVRFAKALGKATLPGFDEAS
jgi:hypothetical protein